MVAESEKIEELAHAITLILHKYFHAGPVRLACASKEITEAVIQHSSAEPPRTEHTVNGLSIAVWPDRECGFIAEQPRLLESGGTPEEAIENLQAGALERALKLAGHITGDIEELVKFVEWMKQDLRNRNRSKLMEIVEKIK